MKSIKDFIINKPGTLDDFIASVNNEITGIDDTLTNDTPILHAFLKDANKVVVSVSNEKKAELGLSSNVLRVENMDTYPLGFSHSHLTETKVLIVGKNSTFSSFEDAKNYAAAMIASDTSGKILIIRLDDRKFTNKIWYVISDTFSNSKFLEVPAVIIGDAALGDTVASNLSVDLKIQSDGKML